MLEQIYVAEPEHSAPKEAAEEAADVEAVVELTEEIARWFRDNQSKIDGDE